MTRITPSSQVRSVTSKVNSSELGGVSFPWTWQTTSQASSRGALVEVVVASYLGAWASKTVGQLNKVMIENDHLLVGTDLTVSNGVIHLHKF
jgi:hypothetical protein